jgi:hypothetical protein
MEIPKEIKDEKDDCLVLNKTIYGLVQRARELYKKLVVCALKGCEFKVCSVDPYFCIKFSDLVVTLIVMYVDDCSVIGVTKSSSH